MSEVCHILNKIAVYHKSIMSSRRISKQHIGTAKITQLTSGWLTIS